MTREWNDNDVVLIFKNRGWWNIMDTIYVHVRHSLFWYGVYGLCDKSWNDEITLYSDKNKTNFLGHFDLLTQPCLINLLNNELDKNKDKEYCNEIEDFIRSNKDIMYSYLYPRDEEDISYQVSHFAPMNDKGHKPTYIYVWSKLSSDWDMMSIKGMVKILAHDFLNMNIKKVVLLNIPTYEETKVSYESDFGRYDQS